jgi:Polyketide cyclase / dehydrase and lipid transport
MAKKLIIGVVGVVVLAVGWYAFQLQRETAKWQQAKEIDNDASFYEKDGGNSKMRFVSVIDAPLDKVQAALWQVERSAEIVENISRSKLIKQDGNVKVLEMHVQPLNLPLQYYTMEFTFFPDKHRVEFKTVDSNTQDISGSYQLEASPDGTRTKLTYDAAGKDKVAIPVPESVIESASKQTYVNTVRGITKVAKSG